MAWDDSDDDDWDNDAKLPTLPGGPAKDPDAETWSDEEGHDPNSKQEEEEKAAAIAAQAPKAPEPPKPKTGLAKKIEEREKREAAEKAAKAAMRSKMASNAVEITDDMDDALKEKLRRQAAEEAADLDSAIDAFGIEEDAKDRAPVEDKTPGGAFEMLKLSVEKDFEKVGELVTKKLAPHEQTKNHLVALKAILRGATINMSTEDTKDLNNFLSVISNAKLQADRDKDKQKKNVSKKKDKFANAAAKARDNDDGAYDAFM